jgi:hypothetical protein
MEKGSLLLWVEVMLQWNHWIVEWNEVLERRGDPNSEDLVLPVRYSNVHKAMHLFSFVCHFY